MVGDGRLLSFNRRLWDRYGPLLPEYMLSHRIAHNGGEPEGPHGRVRFTPAEAMPSPVPYLVVLSVRNIP